MSTKYVTIEGDLASFKGVHRIIPRDKWGIVQGETKPFIECPVCGSGILGDGAMHGVHADGRVYESVICMEPNCKFHSHVMLEGWDGGEIPRGRLRPPFNPNHSDVPPHDKPLQPIA